MAPGVSLPEKCKRTSSCYQRLLATSTADFAFPSSPFKNSQKWPLMLQRTLSSPRAEICRNHQLSPVCSQTATALPFNAREKLPFIPAGRTPSSSSSSGRWHNLCKRTKQKQNNSHFLVWSKGRIEDHLIYIPYLSSCRQKLAKPGEVPIQAKPYFVSAITSQ